MLSMILENQTNNTEQTPDAPSERCIDGEHAYEHEYISGSHVFTCATCKHSVILPSYRLI